MEIVNCAIIIIVLFDRLKRAPTLTPLLLTTAGYYIALPLCRDDRYLN